MAGSLQHEDFVMLDCWPGVPNSQAPTVPNGFDSTQAGNFAVAGSPTYPCGTKIQGFQDSTVGAGGSHVANKGYYTMMYAQYHDYTTGDLTDPGMVVTMACCSAQALGEMGVAQDITSGNDISLAGGPAGIACCSLSDTQYGWFWVGGVCPNYDVTSLDDVTGFITDGNVTAGDPLCIRSNDVTQASLCALSDLSVGPPIVGYAFADDT